MAASKVAIPAGPGASTTASTAGGAAGAVLMGSKPWHSGVGGEVGAGSGTVAGNGLALAASGPPSSASMAPLKR